MPDYIPLFLYENWSYGQFFDRLLATNQSPRDWNYCRNHICTAFFRLHSTHIPELTRITQTCLPFRPFFPPPNPGESPLDHERRHHIMTVGYLHAVCDAVEKTYVKNRDVLEIVRRELPRLRVLLKAILLICFPEHSQSTPPLVAQSLEFTRPSSAYLEESLPFLDFDQLHASINALGGWERARAIVTDHIRTKTRNRSEIPRRQTANVARQRGPVDMRAEVLAHMKARGYSPVSTESECSSPSENLENSSINDGSDNVSNNCTPPDCQSVYSDSDDDFESYYKEICNVVSGNSDTESDKSTCATETSSISFPTSSISTQSPSTDKDVIPVAEKAEIVASEKVSISTDLAAESNAKEPETLPDEGKKAVIEPVKKPLAKPIAAIKDVFDPFEILRPCENSEGAIIENVEKRLHDLKSAFFRCHVNKIVRRTKHLFDADCSFENGKKLGRLCVYCDKRLSGLESMFQHIHSFGHVKMTRKLPVSAKAYYWWMNEIQSCTDQKKVEYSNDSTTDEVSSEATNATPKVQYAGVEKVVVVDLHRNGNRQQANQKPVESVILPSTFTIDTGKGFQNAKSARTRRGTASKFNKMEQECTLSSETLELLKSLNILRPNLKKSGRRGTRKCAVTPRMYELWMMTIE